jgi:hypothetical protein
MHIKYEVHITFYKGLYISSLKKVREEIFLFSFNESNVRERFV